MERWHGQSEITIVTPVKPEAMSALGELLGAMARDVLGNDVLPFGRLTNTHFARFFLLDSAQVHDGIQLPAYLIFMSDIDGRPEEGLTELVDVGERRFYVLHEISQLDLDPGDAGFAAVVFGHSHQPMIETRQRVLFLNPGSAGPRRFKLPVTVARVGVSGRRLRPEIVELQV